MMFQKLTKLAVGPLAILMLTGASLKGDRLLVGFDAQRADVEICIGKGPDI